MKKGIGFAIAAVLMAAAGSVAAQTASVSPAAASALSGAGNPTVPATIAVNWDAGAGTADGVEFELAFDATKVSVTAAAVGSAVCSVGPGLITVIVADVAGNTIPSGTFCNLTFTTLAGAVDGDAVALTLQNGVASDGVTPLPAPTLQSGVINVADAPPVTPPTITGAYVPNGAAAGNVGATVNVGTIDFTVTAPAQNGGTGSVTCSDSDAGNPPALTVNPANQTGLTTTVTDVLVGCTLTDVAQNGTVNCSINGGAATPFAVTCPAGTINTGGPVPPRPAIIPASSLWSQLSLVGLLAALGLLVVALRRNH